MAGFVENKDEGLSFQSIPGGASKVVVGILHEQLSQ